MLLAIDTSTTQTGLAYYDQSGLLGECVWESQRNHTSQVIPQIDMLLRHIGREQSDIQAVGVALGPGSWSGLRVGLSIAKGFAFASGLQVIGIGTLDALAYQYQHMNMPVYPLIRLGRERFATARFQYMDGWNRVSNNINSSLTELCTTIKEPVLFCGDIDTQAQETLRHLLGEYAHFPHEASSIRRTGYLAFLAWQRFLANDYDDVALLEPVYLGEPVKQTA